MQLRLRTALVGAMCLTTVSCGDGATLNDSGVAENILLTFDADLGVDRTTFEPVLIWNRVDEFGDYSVQIPVGDHDTIEKSSSTLMKLGFQGGGYSWEALTRASLEEAGVDPDDIAEWGSESATMVAYVATEQNAALIAKHAQLALFTDETLNRLVALAGDDME